jgi:hypothetical protein
MIDFLLTLSIVRIMARAWWERDESSPLKQPGRADQFELHL